MADESNETAWVLDDSVAVADDGATIAGFPGLWRPGVAVHPDAFGMGVAEFRDAVAALGLPLVEVKTTDAIHEFSREGEAGRFPSSDVRSAMGSAPLDADEPEIEDAPDPGVAARAAIAAATGGAAADEEETD